MPMRPTDRRPVLATVTALAAAAVLAACQGAAPSGPRTVTVYGTWGGSEQDSFLAMVKPFEDRTGIKVQYTGTRDLNAVLTTGVASGILPDLAGLPGPGQMAEFARAGKLVDLSTVLDVNTYKAETAPALVDLGTVDGKLVGVFIKTAVKGLIWYDPKVYKGGVPATWDDLQQKGKAAAAAAGSRGRSRAVSPCGGGSPRQRPRWSAWPWPCWRCCSSPSSPAAPVVRRHVQRQTGRAACPPPVASPAPAPPKRRVLPGRCRTWWGRARRRRWRSCSRPASPRS